MVKKRRNPNNVSRKIPADARHTMCAGATEDGILESVIAGRQVRLMSAMEARQLLIQFRNDRAKRRNGGRFAPIETVFGRL